MYARVLYANTLGNGPTQSRLTLFARSLEDYYYYMFRLSSHVIKIRGDLQAGGKKSGSALG